MKRLAFILCFLFASVLPAHATVYYVSLSTNTPAGSDANDCSISTPCETAQHVETLVSCGDTIKVRAGTYVGKGNMGVTYGANHTCTSWGSPITYQAYENETVILKDYANNTGILGFATCGGCYPTAHDIYWIIKGFQLDGTGELFDDAYVIQSLAASYVILQDIEVYNCTRACVLVGNGGTNWLLLRTNFHNSGIACIGKDPTACGHAYAVCVYVVSQSTIVNGGSFHDCAGGGIQFSSNDPDQRDDDGIVANATFYGNSTGDGSTFNGGNYGLVMQSGARLLAYNNIIYHNYGGGLGMPGVGSCTDCKGLNNTIYGNVSCGICSGFMEVGGGGALRVTFDNNAITANDLDIWLVGGSGHVLHNNVYDGMLQDDTSTATISGNIHSNPAFVNPADPTRDFHLQAGSPAIAAGLDLSATFTTDFYGATRPIPFDVGAIAYNPSSCTPDHLTFTGQPGNAALGSPIPGMMIAIKDSGGSTCTAQTDTITLSKTSGQCTGMTLGGTVSASAVAGVFTANNVNLTVAVGTCELDVAASGMTGATSNSFTVNTSTGAGSRSRLTIR